RVEQDRLDVLGARRVQHAVQHAQHEIHRSLGHSPTSPRPVHTAHAALRAYSLYATSVPAAVRKNSIPATSSTAYTGSRSLPRSTRERGCPLSLSICSSTLPLPSGARVSMNTDPRSEERRVGKGWRCRWAGEA